MALDVGSKVIGIAISDPLRMTASPLTTIRRKELQWDVKEVLKLADSNNVARIILGRPAYLSGHEKEAEKLMGELGIKPSERRKKRDQFAAALILQWYLEETSYD